jgi:hypothetical protein
LFGAVAGGCKLIPPSGYQAKATKTFPEFSSTLIGKYPGIYANDTELKGNPTLFCGADGYFSDGYLFFANLTKIPLTNIILIHLTFLLCV